MPIMIITPPMVGFQIFLLCDQLDRPALSVQLSFSCENNFINGAPIIKTTTMLVTTDKPVRKVRYLNTFKNEYCSINDVNKLSNYIPDHFFTKIIKSGSV